MNTHSLRTFCCLGALTAFATLRCPAQTIEFQARLDSAQETTGSTSTATGLHPDRNVVRRGLFQQTYGGDEIKLLTGGAYLNVHSNVDPAGEVRGQVHVSEDPDVSRLVNLSARGFVGTGDQVLISGFVITGSDPIRVLVTARGPSLTALGVSGALADPALSLNDRTGRQIVANDNLADGFSSADLPSTGFAPADPQEAALLLVLPPGVYTTVVSGVGNTTGVALTEVFESRPGATAP